jgi:hypothetical protein
MRTQTAINVIAIPSRLLIGTMCFARAHFVWTPKLSCFFFCMHQFTLLRAGTLYRGFGAPDLLAS